MATGTEKLFAMVWEAFLDGGDLNGYDVENMLARSCLAVWQYAKPEDCQGRDELEPGDPILVLLPEGKAALMNARKVDE